MRSCVPNNPRLCSCFCRLILLWSGPRTSEDRTPPTFDRGKRPVSTEQESQPGTQKILPKTRSQTCLFSGRHGEAAKSPGVVGFCIGVSLPNAPQTESTGQTQAARAFWLGLSPASRGLILTLADPSQEPAEKELPLCSQAGGSLSSLAGTSSLWSETCSSPSVGQVRSTRKAPLAFHDACLSAKAHMYTCS